jgi:hypothetical protein
MPPNQIFDIIPPKAHYLYNNKTGFWNIINPWK